MRDGLGWRSLDSRESVSGVQKVSNRDALIRIAYEARNPEARRMALLQLGDKLLFESFAKYDKSPIVRRRMVREIDDADIIRTIAENDDDRSVRDSAYKRLEELEKAKNAVK